MTQAVATHNTAVPSVQAADTTTLLERAKAFYLPILEKHRPRDLEEFIAAVGVRIESSDPKVEHREASYDHEARILWVGELVADARPGDLWHPFRRRDLAHAAGAFVAHELGAPDVGHSWFLHLGRKVVDDIRGLFHPDSVLMETVNVLGCEARFDPIRSGNESLCWSSRFGWGGYHLRVIVMGDASPQWAVHVTSRRERSVAYGQGATVHEAADNALRSVSDTISERLVFCSQIEGGEWSRLLDETQADDIRLATEAVVILDEDDQPEPRETIAEIREHLDIIEGELLALEHSIPAEARAASRAVVSSRALHMALRAARLRNTFV